MTSPYCSFRLAEPALPPPAALRRGDACPTLKALIDENTALRARLNEYAEVVRAIGSGEVDAFCVGTGEEARIVTVEGAESEFRTLVEGMNEGAAILLDTGTLLYANGRLALMLRTPLEHVIGQSLFSFLGATDRRHVERLLVQARSRTCAREVALHHLDGSTEQVRVSLSPMRFHGRACVCAVVTDLSAHARQEAKLRSLSLVDELTGLFNRRGFVTLAEQQIRQARRARSELLLFFADLDGLKPINDGLGHVEGDRALVDAAGVLRAAFRESDVIARIGGDEFVVLAPGTPELDPAVLVERLHRHVEARNAAADRRYRLGLSVGVVRHWPHTSSLTLSELLQRADAAMYDVKRAKRGGPAPAVA